jgi:hypothetical protein
MILMNKMELERKHAPRSDHQLFEMGPLKRFPLLHENERSRPYSKRLLNISLQYGTYGLLREYNVRWFVNEFGHEFERYVEKLINHKEVQGNCRVQRGAV